MTQTSKPVSPLRQRMIDDMRMRKLSDATQSHYIRAVKNLTRYLGRSPDTATLRDQECPCPPHIQSRIYPGSSGTGIRGEDMISEFGLEFDDAIVSYDRLLCYRQGAKLASESSTDRGPVWYIASPQFSAHRQEKAVSP